MRPEVAKEEFEERLKKITSIIVIICIFTPSIIYIVPKSYFEINNMKHHTEFEAKETSFVNYASFDTFKGNVRVNTSLFGRIEDTSTKDRQEVKVHLLNGNSITLTFKNNEIKNDFLVRHNQNNKGRNKI